MTPVELKLSSPEQVITIYHNPRLLMISFIIIGRNEEHNLGRCINGIYGAIGYNKIKDYEIIYVDSRSSDNSIAVVKKFSEVKIFQITGFCNAAIGRNVGALESHGQTLFFIDADMEIKKEFLSQVFDLSGNLTFDIVSGQLTDVINGAEKRRFSNQFLGGIFLIRKQLWDSVNGMRTKYTTGEDLDLGMTLAGKGYPLCRKNSVITNHYTVHAFDRSRMWKMIWNKSAFYPRSVLYRDHLFSKQMYQKAWASDKTLLLLVLVIASAVVNLMWTPWLFLIYLIAITIRSLKQKVAVPVYELMVYYLVFNFMTIILFFTFFPKSRNMAYTAI